MGWIYRAVTCLIIMPLLLSLTASASMAKEYKGPKKRIAVIDFEDKSQYQHGGWRDVGGGMTEMLITALVKTKRFIVVEREQIHMVMTEQASGTSLHPPC